ncbi:hypothetical protein AB0C93_21995 [Streptomyces sp. NPDC048518]|uniref:hypothetical protein n=1 Tax=Streptomyces sp. NPDC048518 TaxID=3155029 RepID=UPI003408884D
MRGRRARSLPLLTLVCGAALLTVTSCGTGPGTPTGAAGPSPSGGHGGRFEVRCAGKSFTFYEGTPPPDGASACPEAPAPSPTPTVTMTPRFVAGKGWRGPKCGPRDKRGVTRRGTPLTCSPSTEDAEWRLLVEPEKGGPCVDEGEWDVRIPPYSLVCRDKVWRRGALRNPSPSRSDTPKRVPMPPDARWWHAQVPGQGHG